MVLCACRQCKTTGYSTNEEFWAELCPLEVHVLKPSRPGTQNVTVFEDGVLKAGLLFGWALIHSNRFPPRRGLDTYGGKTVGGHREKTAVCGPESSLRRTQHCADLGLPDARLRGSTLLLCKPPVIRCCDGSLITLIQESSRK